MLKRWFASLTEPIQALWLRLTLGVQRRIPARYRRLLWNRYALVLAYMVIYLLFLDKYDLLSRGKRMARIHQLEQEQRFYTRDIERLRKEQHILQHDLAQLEQVARSSYYMKRPDEDVYLVEAVPQ